jgi:hypothetical protein
VRRSRRWVRHFFLCAVAAAVGGMTSAAAEAAPSRVGPFVSLCDMGVCRAEVDDGQREVVAVYDLPGGAAQGEEEWYTFRLAATVHYSGAGPGASSIAATTNGRVVSQVELRSDGDAHVSSFYSGLITGPVRGESTNRSELFDYENYLQFKGVVGGRNVLRIVLEPLEGHLVDRVEIDTNVSGIRRTSIHPYQLGLTAPTELRVRPGERFSLPVRAERKGERPDRAATLTADAGDVRLDSAQFRFPHLSGGQTVAFRGTAPQEGRHEVRLKLAASLNDPAVVTVLVVEPAPSVRQPVAILAGGALVMAVGGIMARRQTRRGS